MVCIRMKINPYFSSCTKLNSKWIKDIHIKPDTLNLIEEKVGKSLEFICTWRNFLNRTPIAQPLKSIIEKWNFMKPKSFCKVKISVNRTNHNLQIGENVFTNPTSHRGVISKILKDSRS